MSPLEAREGSSQVTTRSVAAALRGEHLDVYGMTGWQRLALTLLGGLPQPAVRRVIELNQSASGAPRALAQTVRTADLARESLAHYAGLEGPFDAVLIGAAGQGTAHIAAAMGAPYLPQPFVLSFRGAGSRDVRAYQRNGQALAEPILARNPDVVVVNHFDPVHDGWLIPYVNHVRLKLTSLPPEYTHFVRARLRPGGALMFIDCTAAWPQYRVGPRLTFQVGGWGGIEAREFIDGGEATGKGWALDFPLEAQPESEWGTGPGLRESVREFAEREGYRFLPVTVSNPEQLAEIAFEAYRRLFEKEGRPPAGVLVEMFTRSDPAAARQARLLPCWLIWNATDSLAFLRRMLPRFPEGRPILFTPLANFSATPDMVPWEDWARAFDGRPWRTLGFRPGFFPSDVLGLWRPGEALAGYCARHPDPVTATLTPDELAECVEALERNPKGL